MAKHTYNVGIIGYGLSANTFHIPCIKAIPEFKLYAIVDNDQSRGNKARRDHSTVNFHHSVEEMLHDQQVDLVTICTAPGSHYQLAKLVLEAKKHAVVEKPFTPTLKEAKDLIDIANGNNVILTVFQNRRWDSDFLTLQKLIKANTFGRIVEFETRFDRHEPDPPPDTWRAYPGPGTGAIYDLGSHVLDQVLVLFGLPQRLTAFIGAQRAINTTGLGDSCTVLLHYQGMMVTVKTGVISPEVKQLRYWIRGEKGSFKKFHLDPQEDQINAGLHPGDKGYGVEREDHHGVLNIAENGKIREEIVETVTPATYVEFYRKLRNAIQGDLSEIPVKPQQAASVIHLIELAIESSRCGKTLEV